MHFQYRLFSEIKWSAVLNCSGVVQYWNQYSSYKKPLDYKFYWLSGMLIEIFDSTLLSAYFKECPLFKSI